MDAEDGERLGRLESREKGEGKRTVVMPEKREGQKRQGRRVRRGQRDLKDRGQGRRVRERGQ